MFVRLHSAFAFCMATIALLSETIAYPANVTQDSLRSREERAGKYHNYFWIPQAGSTKSKEREVATDLFWKEAILLATVAFVSVHPEDPVFLRYFEANDAGLVQGIFKIISGAADDNFQFGSEKFKNLWLFEGSSPFLLVPGQCESPESQRRGLEAVASEDLPSRRNHKLGNGVLAVSMCPIMWDWPALLKISCECLGDRDSYRMNSGGASLLHEIVHWHNLLYPAPGFSQMIGERIVDFNEPPQSPTPDPPSGYGPFNAATLAAHKDGSARRNADNYRWYALSKFWQRHCKRETPFGPATENLAGMPTSIVSAAGGTVPIAGTTDGE